MGWRSPLGRPLSVCATATSRGGAAFFRLSLSSAQGLFPYLPPPPFPVFWVAAVMSPVGGFRALAAAAATVGAVVAGLAAVSSLTTAAQAPQPFPAPLPVSCDETPRVRKEVGSLTAAEWATYQRAVVGLHERETSDKRETLDWFERFIEMHRDYAEDAHNGAHFLAWHRLFLLAYENALRTVEPTVTLPYWDWSMDAKGLELAPVWDANRLGGAKKDSYIVGGAFDKFHVDTGAEGPHEIVRGFQSQKRGTMRRLPLSFADKATMESLWSNKGLNFERFSRALEAEHGMVHVAVGGFHGDMVDLAKASGDVVFWSHHAYIDYVWSRRQEAFPSEKYVGKQGSKEVSVDDILAPFNTKVRYAVELKCVTYIADSRETRPPPSVVSQSTVVEAKSPAWLPCASDADCGCGSCVNKACVIGTTARTVAKCGAVSKCIRHPNPTVRQLVCRCLDTKKCECTRSADCGCGVCRRSDGTCQAPLAVRLESYCGPGSKCVKRCAKAHALTCVSGIHCKVHADCGCGLCVRSHCLTRQQHTQQKCGADHTCVVAGATLVCKPKPADQLGETADDVDTEVLAAGAVRVSAKSAAVAEKKKLRALALFQKIFDAASKKEAKLVAKVQQETKILLAEADADADAVVALAVAAQKKVAASGTGRFHVDARGSTLGVVARATKDTKLIAQMEVKVQKRSKEVRKRARHELWQAKKRSQRRLRRLVLTGFTVINNLNTRKFLSGEALVKSLGDKADDKAEEKEIDGAEADEDAEVEDGTITN